MGDVGTQVPCSHTGAGVTLIVPTATRLRPPGSAHVHRPLSRYPRPAKRILASHSASKSGDLQRVLDAWRMAIGYVIVPVALVLHRIPVRCKIAARRAGDTLYEVCGEWCVSHGGGPDRPRAACFTRIGSRTRRPRLPCRVANGCSWRAGGGRLLAVLGPNRLGCRSPPSGAMSVSSRSPGQRVAVRSAEGSPERLLGAERPEPCSVSWPWLRDTPRAAVVTASRAVLIGIPSSEVPGVTSVSSEFRPPESDTPEFQ